MSVGLRRRRAAPRDPVAELLWHVKLAGVPEPTRELRFAAAVRGWRFDLAWPDRRLAVEIDGGVFTQGRHTRGPGYEEDCRKRAAAVLLGWRVVNVTPGMIARGEAIAIITEAYNRGGTLDRCADAVADLPTCLKVPAVRRRARRDRVRAAQTAQARIAP